MKLSTRNLTSLRVFALLALLVGDVLGVVKLRASLFPEDASMLLNACSNMVSVSTP
jgi:hypothetical protein